MLVIVDVKTLWLYGTFYTSSCVDGNVKFERSDRMAIKFLAKARVLAKWQNYLR